MRGRITGIAASSRQDRVTAGALFSAKGEGWKTVASVANAAGDSQAAGQGQVYVYLGRWIWQGADALRPVLAYAGRQAAPLVFDKPDDQLEYVAYRKNRGAWVALFNHGGIVIGCDRLDRPSGGWRRPSRCVPRLAAPTAARSSSAWTGWASTLRRLRAVRGAGHRRPGARGVISGRKTFEVKDIPFESGRRVSRPPSSSTSVPST